jgi:hypothetical protein
MKMALHALLLLALSSDTALAQGSHQTRGWVYGFGAIVRTPGFSGTASHAGLGGELRIRRHLVVAADGGTLTTHAFTNAVGLLSMNLAHHFDNATLSRTLVPFATGGLTIANGCVCGMNVGGGAQYWAIEHVGARLEVRSYFLASDLSRVNDYRFGVALR